MKKGSRLFLSMILGTRSTRTSSPIKDSITFNSSWNFPNTNLLAEPSFVMLPDNAESGSRKERKGRISNPVEAGRIRDTQRGFVR